MKKIKKVILVVVVFFLIIIFFELGFLSLLKNKDVIRLIQRKAFAYALSTILVDSRDNNYIYSAKTEIQYQGKISKLSFIEDNKTLVILLIDNTNKEAKETTLKISRQSSSITNRVGKLISIEEIKVGDTIKISFLSDYKQLKSNTYVKVLPRD